MVCGQRYLGWFVVPAPGEVRASVGGIFRELVIDGCAFPRFFIFFLNLLVTGVLASFFGSLVRAENLTRA